VNNPKEEIARAVTPALPLQGKTILVTRPKDQAEEFARLLSERGARIVFIPTIEITEPESWQGCDAAIDDIRKYDGLIFTSATAVQAFFRRWKLHAHDFTRKEVGNKISYALGEKTGEALVDEGITPTLLPGVTNGIEMAEALSRLPIRGKNYLFPQGNLAGKELAALLRSNGARVDETTVYATVAPRDEDARSLRYKVEKESVDIVTFFSTSSVKNLLAMIPAAQVSTKIIAVLGSSTEAAAKEAGLCVQIMPVRPTSTDMVDAIVQFYAKRTI
jgi:uroporphyrinogen-III synthase